MYKRILLAYDGSSCSAKALDEAIILAKAQSAILCIATIDDDGELHGGMDLQAYVDRVGKVKKIRSTVQKMLTDAFDKASDSGCQVEMQLVKENHRHPAEAIADTAKEWKADLVIVGTHGRRGFQRLLVGSVAENLVRIASTSLLLVREDASVTAA